jgi:hypothetical protein
MKQHVLPIILLLAILALPAYAKDNCFPGKERTLSSPGGQEVTWIERKSDNESHHLFSRVSTATESHELLTFDREVCIYWSPDDRQFAVTNYVGSNVAETLIYKAGNTAHPVDVTDLLPKKVRHYFGKGMLHGHIEAVSWDRGGLIIRVFGDREDKPRNFDMLLKCFEEKGKWICRKTAANNQMHRPRYLGANEHTPTNKYHTGSTP